MANCARAQLAHPVCQLEQLVSSGDSPFLKDGNQPLRGGGYAPPSLRPCQVGNPQETFNQFALPGRYTIARAEQYAAWVMRPAMYSCPAHRTAMDLTPWRYVPSLSRQQVRPQDWSYRWVKPLGRHSAVMYMIGSPVCSPRRTACRWRGAPPPSAPKRQPLGPVGVRILTSPGCTRYGSGRPHRFAVVASCLIRRPASLGPLRRPP